MESEGIFLRWWHFSSLLYCDDSFDNTCPCFWQEQNFVVAAAKLIKKPQRGTVCHRAQCMGGATVNKAAIILKSIWTRMVKNRSLDEWDLIRVGALSLAREHGRYKGSKQWMEIDTSDNKALTQRSGILFLRCIAVFIFFGTNKHVYMAIGYWYIVEMAESAPIYFLQIRDS